MRAEIAVRGTLTFVDGYLVEPDADGSLRKPLNATVEMYVFDRIELPDGTAFAAYFLSDLDEAGREERLAALV